MIYVTNFPGFTHGAAWSIYASVNYVIIDSDESLAAPQRQTIVRSNAELFIIGHSRINFCEILIEIQPTSFKRIYLEMPSAKGGYFVSTSMC